ncbi:MAG: glutamate-5-semialdehyde dehydrogenase [Eggerthellaceae bacterium]|jgi:glutamate-5-semialdehyde dehydrogenase
MAQMTVKEQALLAKEAARKMAVVSAEARNRALCNMAHALRDHTDQIVEANGIDMDAARKDGMSAPKLDRLMLDAERIEGMAQALESLALLPDPVGQIRQERTLASGVQLQLVTVPMGVVAMVYEARPNVTADAAGISLKAGNSCILRGGSSAVNSNIVIAEVLRQAAVAAGLPEHCITLIGTKGHAATDELLRLRGIVDLLIPRGGAGLINHCVETATVPVIETGTGNNTVYVHAPADLSEAVRIIMNAKCQRPGVCNAIENVLADEALAPELYVKLLPALAEAGVEIRGDEPVQEAGERCGVAVVPAKDEDWDTEYLDLIISIKTVTGPDEAISHINEHGTGHSECIVTDDEDAAERFLASIDAAAVYWNASTRFTDGGEFGLGAEIGISTQKTHVRGPFALEALVTTKYLLRGTGQVR